MFTGHCFRRSSASVLANAGANSARIRNHGGWKRDASALGYIETSLHYKKKMQDFITAAITSNSENMPPPLAKKAKPNSFVPAADLAASSSSAANVSPNLDPKTNDHPVIDNFVISIPTTDESVTENIAAVEPVIQHPISQEAGTKEFATEEPATDDTNSSKKDEKKIVNLPSRYPYTISLTNCTNFKIHIGKE